MIVILTMLVVLGMVGHTSSIQCYTCVESGYYCTLPLNLDAGDESNENNVATTEYDPGYACMSDYSINPENGEEKLILSGKRKCHELNIPNHRIHCCYEDFCNKVLPKMITQSLADLNQKEFDFISSHQRCLSSILLLVFNLLFAFFLLD